MYCEGSQMQFKWKRKVLWEQNLDYSNFIVRYKLNNIEFLCKTFSKLTSKMTDPNFFTGN